MNAVQKRWETNSYQVVKIFLLFLLVHIVTIALFYIIIPSYYPNIPQDHEIPTAKPPPHPFEYVELDDELYSIVRYKDIVVPHPETFVSEIPESKYHRNGDIHKFNIGACEYTYNQKTKMLSDRSRNGSMNINAKNLLPGNRKKMKSLSNEAWRQQLQEMFRTYEYMSLFARLNDILYIVKGGGMLGICRDSQFLPWDNDLDFSFHNADFYKFMQFYEYFANKKDAKYYKGIREHPSTEMWRTLGPLYIHFYHVTVLMTIYPDQQFMKFFSTYEEETYVHLRKGRFKGSKNITIYPFFEAAHLDVTPCNWDEKKKRCYFVRFQSLGPKPTDTADQFVVKDYCGVPTYLPKEGCDRWLSYYFKKKGWKKKLSPR